MKTHTGLQQSEIAALREQYGFNELKITNKKSLISIFFDQFKNILIVILMIAAVISLFHDPVEAMVIGIIILLNGLVGFFQEFRTEKTLQALNKMVSPTIRVRRDGKEHMIETRLLVPGDMVILQEGDKIPADGVLVHTHSIKAEESALTGESVPVEKSIDDDVYMGTSIVRGSGLMRVTSIGHETRFGEIARLATTTQKTTSPIQKELASIGVFVAKMTGIITFILIVVHVLRNMNGGESFMTAFIEAFTFGVSVAIAAVPEGLATTITIALAIGALALSRKNAIVKKLSAAETLGTVSTICSDKTGTLTKNEMTVRSIMTSDGQVGTLTGIGYNPDEGGLEGDITDMREFLRMADIAYYCNEAKLVPGKDGVSILGDPTEAALLTMAEKIYDTASDDRTEYVLEDMFPFDSNRKMMSVVATDTYEKSFVFVKGSPDQVLAACVDYWDGQTTMAMGPEQRALIQEQYDTLAKQALRVLALAYKPATEHPENQEHAESDLIYVGLVGMIDPPRSDVKKAIAECNTAGIRTIVITGDYGITAGVIAQELGIVEPDRYRIITGTELETLSDQELTQLLADRDHDVIFARSMPAQKMRIVESLQHHGEIVAMTGDGVNDAPALKRADIGVAMGITGTEVSKEAATLILLDDSFSTIVSAIKEGRRIYDNLKKFVLYTLSSNIGELVVIFISILSGIPLILTAVLILIVNLGTDILPAIALGVDKAEPGLMKRKPRDPQARVLSRHFIKRLFGIGVVLGISVITAFIYTLLRDGWVWGNPFDELTLQHAQTVAFAALVIAQLMNSFSVKSTKPIGLQHIISNRFHIIAILVSVGIVAAVAYVPGLNRVLGTQPLAAHDWSVIMIFSVIPVVIFEITKYLQVLRTKKKKILA